MENKIDLLPIDKLPKNITVMYSTFDEGYGYGGDALAIIENGYFLGVIEGTWLGDDYEDDANKKTYQLEYIDIMNECDRRRGIGTRAFQLLKEKYGATHIIGMVEPFNTYTYSGDFRKFIEKFGASIVETFDDDNMGNIWAGEGTFEDYIETYFTIEF